MLNAQERALARNAVARTALARGCANPLITPEDIDSQLYALVAEVLNSQNPASGPQKAFGVESALTAIFAGSA